MQMPLARMISGPTTSRKICPDWWLCCTIRGSGNLAKPGYYPPSPSCRFEEFCNKAPAAAHRDGDPPTLTRPRLLAHMLIPLPRIRATTITEPCLARCEATQPRGVHQRRCTLRLLAGPRSEPAELWEHESARRSLFSGWIRPRLPFSLISSVGLPLPATVVFVALSFLGPS